MLAWTRPAAWAWLIGSGSIAAVLAGCGFISRPAARAGSSLLSHANLLPYAAGACQKFAPTNGNNHHTVFIDPGHGGPDPGTSGTAQSGDTIDERTATLAVASDLAALLRAEGYTVVLSRTTDSSVLKLGPNDIDQGIYTQEGNHRDLLARVQCADQSHADLLLSIHFNAFEDPAVGGAETYYDNARPFASNNERLAGLVQQDLVAALATGGWDIPDRGIRLDTDNAEPVLPIDANYPYLVLLGPAQGSYLPTASQMPGTLSEVLFLSDPYEASIAASDRGQRTIASGFATAVQHYFSGASSAETPPP